MDVFALPEGWLPSALLPLVFGRGPAAEIGPFGSRGACGGGGGPPGAWFCAVVQTAAPNESPKRTTVILAARRFMASSFPKLYATSVGGYSILLQRRSVRSERHVDRLHEFVVLGDLAGGVLRCSDLGGLMLCGHGAVAVHCGTPMATRTAAVRAHPAAMKPVVRRPCVLVSARMLARGMDSLHADEA